MQRVRASVVFFALVAATLGASACDDSQEGNPALIGTWETGPGAEQAFRMAFGEDGVWMVGDVSGSVNLPAGTYVATADEITLEPTDETEERSTSSLYVDDDVLMISALLPQQVGENSVGTWKATESFSLEEAGSTIAGRLEIELELMADGTFSFTETETDLENGEVVDEFELTGSGEYQLSDDSALRLAFDDGDEFDLFVVPGQAIGLNPLFRVQE